MSTAMKLVALDVAPLCFGGLDIQNAFSRFGSFTFYDDTASQHVEERAGDAEIVLTNKVKIGSPQMEALPRLKYIGVLATGYNVVDVGAANARGIVVTNVRDYAAQSVSQHVFAMLLAFSNRVVEHASHVAQGEWHSSWCHQVAPTMGLAGKNLGLLGFGAIGKSVAEIGRAFGMNVLLGATPGQHYSSDAKRLDLRTLVRQSDVLSLHCPLTQATDKVMNADMLALMKPSSVFINTGRGGLVDEQALYEALMQGQLAHACLDVLSTEPPPPDHVLLRPELWQTGRITVTGHYAWTSPEARALLIEEAARNVDAFLKGESRNQVA